MISKHGGVIEWRSNRIRTYRSIACVPCIRRLLPSSECGAYNSGSSPYIFSIAIVILD